MEQVLLLYHIETPFSSDHQLSHFEPGQYQDRRLWECQVLPYQHAMGQCNKVTAYSSLKMAKGKSLYPTEDFHSLIMKDETNSDRI